MGEKRISTRESGKERAIECQIEVRLDREKAQPPFTNNHKKRESSKKMLRMIAFIEWICNEVALNSDQPMCERLKFEIQVHHIISLLQLTPIQSLLTRYECECIIHHASHTNLLYHICTRFAHSDIRTTIFSIYSLKKEKLNKWCGWKRERER